MKASNEKFKLEEPLWTMVLPIIAWIVFFIGEHTSWPFFFIISAIALIGGVLSAVHHAEVIAHRNGEPFGA